MVSVHSQEPAMFNLVKCSLFIRGSPCFRAKSTGEGSAEGLTSWSTAFCCFHLSSRKSSTYVRGCRTLHCRKEPYCWNKCFTLSWFSPLPHKREESLLIDYLQLTVNCWAISVTATGCKNPPVTGAVTKYRSCYVLCSEGKFALSSTAR